MQDFSDTSLTRKKASAMCSSSSMRPCSCSSIRKRHRATIRGSRLMELADRGMSAFGSTRIGWRPGSGGWQGLGSQSSLSTSGTTARSPCIFETRPATASSWPRGEFGAMSESTARRCKGGALNAWHKRLDNFSAIYAAIIVCGRDPSPAHRRVPSRGFGRLTGTQRPRR